MPGTEDQAKSEAFTYDNWGRLSQAQTLNLTASGTWKLDWSFDRLGNRLTQPLTGGNLPGGIGQPQFTVDQNTNWIVGMGYDAAGNQTSDGSFSYAYDGGGRLYTVTNTAAEYTYFGGLRIKKVVGSTTTVTIYSGANPIAEYVNGALSKEYIYSGPSLLATLHW